MSSDPRQILLIRLSSLGDVLLTTPAIASLKARFPDASIHFLTRKPSEALIRHHPAIDRIWIYEENETARRQQVQSLKAIGFDVVVDWQVSLRSREFRSVAPRRLTFRKHLVKRFLHVRLGTPLHIDPVPVRYLKSLAPLGVTDSGDGLRVDRPRLLSDRMERIFTDWKGTGRGPVFFIAAGARHFTKRYPVEYTIRLMTMLLELQPFARFILLGGADEMDQAFIIKKAFPDNQLVWNAVGGFSIPESLALMSHCQAGFSNDSFLMHAATACRIPVVAFFGSTTLSLGFGPFRSPALVIEDPSVSCRPCSHIGRHACPKGHFKCMMNLEPETAFPAIYDFLLGHLNAGKQA